MVPPGDNLEFQASGDFRDRIQQVPKILTEAKLALRRDPSLGTGIAGEFKKMDLKISDLDYVVFFRRRKNSVAFVAVFDGWDLSSIEAKAKDIAVRVAKGELK